MKPIRNDKDVHENLMMMMIMMMMMMMTRREIDPRSPIRPSL
jgi:hypothetical protein